MPTLTLHFDHARKVRKSDKTDPNREYLVQLRIYLGVEGTQKTAYLKTRVSVPAKNWSKKKQAVVKHRLAVKLNMELAAMKDRARSIYLELGKDATAVKTRDRLAGRDRTDTVLGKFREYYKRRANRLAEGTIKQERTFFTYLERYAAGLTFGELKYSWVTSFEDWLLNQPNQRRGGTLSRNYVSALLAILRTYCTEAEKEDLIPNNPVKLLRLEKERKEPTYLTHAELMDFAAVNAVGDIQQRAKDMFVFACCTSLRVSDLRDLRKTEIHPTGDGFSLHRIPTKTGARSSGRYHIPIDHAFDGLAGKIYRKYADTIGPYLFPRMDEKSYRAHISVVGRAAGITKKITTHVARHTFAMVALNHYDWRLEEVSRAMGHTNVATTQKYTRVSYQKIVSISKRKKAN